MVYPCTQKTTIGLRLLSATLALIVDQLAMNKVFAVVLLALSTNVMAKGKPEVVYVGDGRYVCQGDKNSPACAQVDANNRQREERRAYEYERKHDDEERRRREFELSSRNSR